MAPVRKNAAVPRDINFAAADLVAAELGFVYIGFPKGSVDTAVEELREVAVASLTAGAVTITLTQYSSAGVVKNQVTIAPTLVAHVPQDGTATQTVVTGKIMPWDLAPGDYVTVIRSVAQDLTVTLTHALKGA
jgi:hypothetical protein